MGHHPVPEVHRAPPHQRKEGAGSPNRPAATPAGRGARVVRRSTPGARLTDAPASPRATGTGRWCGRGAADHLAAGQIWMPTGTGLAPAKKKNHTTNAARVIPALTTSTVS